MRGRLNFIHLYSLIKKRIKILKILKNKLDPLDNYRPTSITSRSIKFCESVG